MNEQEKKRLIEEVDASDKYKDLYNLRFLKPSQHIYIDRFDAVKWEVHRIYDMYILFEIPQHADKPCYINTYNENQLEEIIDTVYNFI